MAPVPWNYTPAERQALRDAETRAAIDQFELLVRRERLAAAVAGAEARRDGRTKTIPAGQSAYRVNASETPYPERTSDDDVRKSHAALAREAGRIVQSSGSELSSTSRSQRDQVAQYLIESRGLRPVVVRDQMGRIRQEWLPGPPPEAPQNGTQNRA
jgi:hypothetical protein